MRQENIIPEPVRLSVRLIGWEKQVIDEWLSDKRKNMRTSDDLNPTHQR